jgi:hypothetical protein
MTCEWGDVALLMKVPFMLRYVPCRLKKVHLEGWLKKMPCTVLKCFYAWRPAVLKKTKKNTCSQYQHFVAI